jgi:hypothetical protein
LRRRLLLLAAPLVAVAASDPPAGNGETDLRSEVDALLSEISGGRVPFLAPDRPPDLVIASTRRVMGEVAPCG